MPPAVLSGAWRDLAVLTWSADPARLQPCVPAGVELDTWNGRALISVVGVTFRDLRVVGVPVPGLQAFTQVNVRIYVRRRIGDEVRHGVRFLLQLAPSRLVVAGARLALHEPYEACDMRLDDVHLPTGRRDVTYAWRGATWHHLRLVLAPEARLESGPGSLETFVLQRCWGYTPQPDGTTLEYAVRHPLWRVHPVEHMNLDARWPPDRVPAEVAGILADPPMMATFALGSPIAVHRPHTVRTGDAAD